MAKPTDAKTTTVPAAEGASLMPRQSRGVIVAPSTAGLKPAPTLPTATTPAGAAPASAPTATAKWGVSARQFYAALRDKPVRVTTLDGKVYSAILVGVDQYDLTLKLANGTLVLIAKHATKLVVPGNNEGEDKKADEGEVSASDVHAPPPQSGGA